ncbi:phage portal protein [Edwardsiella ictaluri]|uniref:Portal protein n=1 Tax=Edwardsiella ictaluri TaxID=67780 RepID=A0A1S6J103_EDWIC|nr:phage portal protein [Edwardsiella ictaluri]AQS60708.1 portal protein [Edwardsiella ictaluri]ELV7528735.1 phage portal protein [Edwardsiella ictaluri]KMQ77519.1 portal protein [Edwardsiella ictaluri]WFN96469.1 phage portal protein [Edwardsiella ictaluri]
MTVIEKVIGVISPGWAANRLRDRLRMKAYEAAMPTRTHPARRERRGANLAVQISAISLREQARALDENHDIVIGLLDKMEERIVGAKGIQIEPQPRAVDGELMEDFAREIRRRWGAWSLKPETTGSFTRPAMERLVCRTWLRDGEVFGRRLMGTVSGYRHHTDTPYSIELLEPDFVPFDMNLVTEKVRQGIRLDEWRCPKSYFVMFDHPGELQGYRYRTKEVAASEMYHLALRKRLHQLRGVTLLHGVMTRLADLKSVEEAERVAARISASMAFFIKKDIPEGYGFKDPQNRASSDTPPSDETERKRSIDISPGAIFDDLKPGEDVGVIKSDRPNTGLNIWRTGQLRSACAGTRSQYSSIGRDYDGTYSAQRQELVEGWEGFTVLQDEFVASWSRPVYRDWLLAETLRSRDPLTLPPGLDMQTLYDAIYLAPVMPWIDPLKEADGWKTIIRGGAGTVTEWIRARNRNPDEVRAQMVVEHEWAQKYGIISDTNPANDPGVQPSEKKPTDGREPERTDASAGIRQRPPRER